MDDLIVLILTLIIFVAGAIGQVKKKKPPVPVAGQKKQPDNFWDLLEQETEFLPEQPTPVTQEIQPEFYQEKYESTEPEKYDFIPVNEGGSLFSEEIKTEKKNDQIRKKRLREEFSLRKAVIYNEILNRKYL